MDRTKNSTIATHAPLRPTMRFREALRMILLLPLTLLAVPGLTNAVADGPLFTTGLGTLRDSTAMRGYAFEVGHELTVTGLAKFDGNENGLLDDLLAPRVGLWNTATSELIVSAFIDEGAVFRDHMFVKSIDPVVLPPGGYTLAVQSFDDQEPYVTNSDFATPTAVIASITPLMERGAEFVMPRNGRAVLGFGPNLLIEPPPVTLWQPRGNFITQRRADNLGTILVAGSFNDALVDSVEVRAVSIDGSSATPWQSVATNGTQFSEQLDFPAGWYQIEARGKSGDRSIGNAAVPNVGIGEVFVMAGQSNSANFGSPALVPEDDRVLSMDAEGNWRHAADPQPVANGTGGSPWPAFGDLLAAKLNVPVGIVSVGWGGTTVGQWLPGALGGPDSAPLYDRLSNALEMLGPNGARAVLWHQGESDASSRTTQEVYAARLTQVIDQSREDAGYEIPWGIALAAFLPGNTVESNATILAAQQQVIDADPLVFAGPRTDNLGAGLRFDGIHFNEAGLRLHAEGWGDAVLPLFIPVEFLAGDLNEDGTLDLADFLLFRINFNERGTGRRTGDLNGDAITDLADFIIFRAAFTASAGAAAVPEPATRGLVLLAVLGFLTVRRPATLSHTEFRYNG